MNNWRSVIIDAGERFLKLVGVAGFLWLLVNISERIGITLMDLFTLASIVFLIFVCWSGFDNNRVLLERILKELNEMKQSLKQTNDPPEEKEEKKVKEEPIKTTGFGAFGGMIIGGMIGLLFGTIGVIVGGVIGALIGDEWERIQIKERRKKMEKTMH
ncbi:MAG: hypothetical protein DRN49_04485 [Thaumarchaeota archaeon]|nr:MAG: hypothetical protein DRN49_04485 [Nitrososphaerota archaeon]